MKFYRTIYNLKTPTKFICLLMFFTFTGSSAKAMFSVSQENPGSAVAGGTLTSSIHTLPHSVKGTTNNNGRTDDFVSENDANLARGNRNGKPRHNRPPIRSAQNRFDFSSTILNWSVCHTGIKEKFSTSAGSPPFAAETVPKYKVSYFFRAP